VVVSVGIRPPELREINWNLFGQLWNHAEALIPDHNPGDDYSMGVNDAAAVGLTQKCFAIRSAHRPRAAGCSPHAIARWLAMFALVIVTGCGLSSCGGGGNGSTTVSTVAITPTSITVPLNTTTTFTAVVTLSDSSVSTTTTITWEVNGISGGDLATVGSIASAADNQLEGIYTAPSSVPTQTIAGVTQVGQVSITAVTTQTTTTKGQTSTGTVTSNTGIVTVGAGSGLAVSPTTPTVAAGATQQFTALLNGLNDTNATWTVTPSSPTSTYGAISASGLYTAPLSPPPGGTVTITATDPAASAPATATLTVSYSDHSLSGPYAFSYTGNDSQGFLAAAGSFVANGNGHLVSGVEDVSSFLTGVKTIQINSDSSTYVIGSDGRGTANIVTSIGQSTWDFVMTTPGHAQITRMDASATGGGTIDQQSLSALSNNTSAITGPYVFNLLGADASFAPLGLAGKFTANGSGTIPESASILDVNDNGIAGVLGIKTSDTTLHGTYEFDPVFTGTGRGLLTLTSNSTGANAREYAFYAVDSPASGGDSATVVRLHLIEIDSLAFVAGDMYAAPAGAAALTAGTYVFTGGGQVPAGAYAAGGAFVSSGGGGITGGNFDANSNGTYNSGPAIDSCSSYTTDPTTGRIDLKMFTGTGACPATPNSSTNEYALYQTSQGTALLLEIDQNALSTGTVYQQCVPPAAACSVSVTLVNGSFAIGLVGQGIFHSDTSAQPDASGQLTISSAGSVTSGTLDINTIGAASPSDPVSASSIAAPTANGRGTATLTTTNPASTFKLVYYLIDDNTALIFDQDTSPIATGIVARQF
jgi:hypothetical protein